MKIKTEFILLLLTVLLHSACKDERKEIIVTREIGPGKDAAPDSQVQLIDNFYKVLTDRDSAGLVNLMSEDARMYGTDPAEDWGLAEIKKYIGDKSRDTSQKAVFTVKKRQVHVRNDLMYVVDVVDVSTIKLPFRILTITAEKEGKKQIVLSEFSALVRNDDMKALEALFLAGGAVH